MFPRQRNILQTFQKFIPSSSNLKKHTINEYKKPITFEPGLLDYFKKRLEISDEDFDKIMLKKPKSYREFPSYKKLFEFLRPVFFFMYKSNLVPKSFYIKYTSKNDI